MRILARPNERLTETTVAVVDRSTVMAASGCGPVALTSLAAAVALSTHALPRTPTPTESSASKADGDGGNLVLQESALVLNDGSVFDNTQMEAISIIHRAKRGRHFHGWKNDPLPRLC